MASLEKNKKTLIPITNQKSPSPSPSPSSFSLTSEENLIDEDDLELSLGIRSINYRACSPTQITKIPFPRSLSEENTAFISKREVQALRRQEAKKKRDLKRKGSSGVNGEGADVERDVLKIPRLHGSYWAPPSWWTWQNNDKIGGTGGGGQNSNFGSFMKNVDESISTGSSSGISDNNYHSFSGPGGNTSSADMLSHSSQTESQLTPQSNIQTPTNSPLQPEPQQQPSNSTPDITHFQTHLSSSSNHHSEQVTNSSEPSSKSPNSITSLEKSPSLTTQNSIPKEATGKPPRPNGQIKQLKTTLPQMPCVSVTGNGPNGKTLTGILYKYTKTEVSIVCVCHGASFSPAGFVEHAGGVDVEHPLRHIRVVPFAL